MATQNLGSQTKMRAQLAGRGVILKQALVDGAAADTNIAVTGLRPGDAIASVMELGGGQLVRDVQLDNAAVKGFRGAPAELIPAPGADKAVIVHKFAIVSDDSAGAWTESADDLVLQYADGVDISAAIEAGDLVGGAVAVKCQGVLDTALVPDVNAAVELFNTGDGEWAGGDADNTMSIRLWYSIIDTVAFAADINAGMIADRAGEAKITAVDTLQLDTTGTVGSQLLITWLHYEK